MLVKLKADFLYASSWPSAVGQLCTADGDTESGRGAKGRRPALAQQSHLLSSHLVCSVKWLLLPSRCSPASKVARKLNMPTVHAICTAYIPPACLEQWFINDPVGQLPFFVFLWLGAILTMFLHPKFSLLLGKEAPMPARHIVPLFRLGIPYLEKLLGVWRAM